ncbi:MAG: D-Ala-D-Ala carboxypeptidase family metallohydrolase [bacterium]
MILIPKKEKSLEVWPTKWFTVDEFSENSEHKTFIVTPKLIETLEVLDILREEINEPLFISNACRFSGSTTSQHFFKNYNAADVWAKNYSSIELMKVVERLDLGTGRGVYPGHKIVHIDCRRGKSSKEGWVSRWYRLDEKSGEVYYTYNKDYSGKPYNGLLD